MLLEKDFIGVLMLFYILLVITTVALYYFYKRYKRSLSAQDSFIVQILILAVMVLFYVKVFSSLFSGNPGSALVKKERSYMELAGLYTGDYVRSYPLAMQKPSKNVLVIDFPQNRKLPGAGMSEDIIKGLEKSFNGSACSISAIERPEESFDSTGDWLSPEAFDAVIKKHPRTDFVISLVGVPRKLGEITFWRDRNAPKLILVRGNISRLEAAFKQKAVIGAMVFIPGVNFKNAKILNTENGKELENMFYEQFIFITPQNLRSAKEDFPELFWKRRY